MHELSITTSILDMVRDEVAQRGYTSVQAIHIKIGALYGIVADSLRAAYELASEDTALANSRLVVEEIPAVIHCAMCGSEQSARSLQWLSCAFCNSSSVEVVSGRELEISALELD